VVGKGSRQFPGAFFLRALKMDIAVADRSQTVTIREGLREAWTEIIQADDYEAHMAAVGQAQANAELVGEYMGAQRLKPDASVLFAGAGTGQMFDFIPPAFFLPFKVTFADVNPRYLQRLAERLAGVEGLRYETLIDDLEQSALSRPFDFVVAVLVLEHVDWRKAVSTMCALAAKKVFVIIQENPENLPAAMTPNPRVPGTMKIFSRVHPALVPAAALEAEFDHYGFARTYSAHKIVLDNKKMLALGFLRGQLFT
jgi:SAM-dependent methyltransferase